MKFVTDIKKDYLYEIRDIKRKKIIIITKIDKYILALYLEDLMDIEKKYNKNVVSRVVETSSLFNQPECYAFYEIGHKDECPEYFL